MANAKRSFDCRGMRRRLGIDGGEFLEGADVPEPRHRFFPSSEWLVRIIGRVVKPPAAFLTDGVADPLHRRVSWLIPMPRSNRRSST